MCRQYHAEILWDLWFERRGVKWCHYFLLTFTTLLVCWQLKDPPPPPVNSADLPSTARRVASSSRSRGPLFPTVNAPVNCPRYPPILLQQQHTNPPIQAQTAASSFRFNVSCVCLRLRAFYLVAQYSPVWCLSWAVCLLVQRALSDNLQATKLATRKFVSIRSVFRLTEPISRVTPTSLQTTRNFASRHDGIASIDCGPALDGANRGFSRPGCRRTVCTSKTRERVYS